MNDITFCESSFAIYYQGNFKSDIERFFTVESNSFGTKYIKGIVPSASCIDLFHPTRTVPIMPAALAANPDSDEAKAFKKKWEGVVNELSIENDWYFSAIFTFMILFQKSVVEHIRNVESLFAKAPLPFILSTRVTESPIEDVLRASYQVPGSPKYYKYYFQAIDVAVPYLLKEYDMVLDSTVSIALKASILRSFQTNLGELIHTFEE